MNDVSIPDQNPDQSLPAGHRWHRLVLSAASLHSAFWGVFILGLPEKSSLVYGFDKPPTDLFLWQGTGLLILLLGMGYAIASRNPVQHWAVILIGLIAKVLGPIGMCQSVLEGKVPARVLILLPVNDVLWWIPFALILNHARTSSMTRP
ncbi:MAG: hypothetical protein KDA96_22315 [Planctomycetaceae bacterium]|nr:hypothetical protein [Planctomycetaceae bacterium]